MHIHSHSPSTRATDGWTTGRQGQGPLSLRIPIRGGQGTIETEVLRLDLYLGDFSGLGSVCPIDRAAGRADQPRGKNEDKPQRNTDQEMDKNIPWD